MTRVSVLLVLVLAAAASAGTADTSAAASSASGPTNSTAAGQQRRGRFFGLFSSLFGTSTPTPQPAKVVAVVRPSRPSVTHIIPLILLQKKRAQQQQQHYRPAPPTAAPRPSHWATTKPPQHGYWSPPSHPGPIYHYHKHWTVPEKPTASSTPAPAVTTPAPTVPTTVPTVPTTAPTVATTAPTVATTAPTVATTAPTSPPIDPTCLVPTVSCATGEYCSESLLLGTQTCLPMLNTGDACLDGTQCSSSMCATSGVVRAGNLFCV